MNSKSARSNDTESGFIEIRHHVTNKLSPISAEHLSNLLAQSIIQHAKQALNAHGLLKPAHRALISESLLN